MLLDLEGARNRASEFVLEADESLIARALLTVQAETLDWARGQTALSKNWNISVMLDITNTEIAELELAAVAQSVMNTCGCAEGQYICRDALRAEIARLEVANAKTD